MLPTLVALFCTTEWPPVFESTKMTNSTLQELITKHPPLKEWLTNQVITNVNVLGSSVEDIAKLYTQATKKSIFHIDVELIVLSHRLADLHGIKWDLINVCMDDNLKLSEIQSYYETNAKMYDHEPVRFKKEVQTSTMPECAKYILSAEVVTMFRLAHVVNGVNYDTEMQLKAHISRLEQHVILLKDTRTKLDDSGGFDSYPPPPSPSAWVAVAMEAAPA